MSGVTMARIGRLKGAAEFREVLSSLGLEVPCDDLILKAPESPLAQPVRGLRLGGKQPGNRCVVHPMEGWDGTERGGATDLVRRRWARFGASGAKLIFGGEAMAVRPDGRANPRQLILAEEHAADFAQLVETLKHAHQERYGTTDDLVVGFQLTHSGRFCRPHDSKRPEPRVAFRHPILDRRVGLTSDALVFRDDELGPLVEAYAQAAEVAAKVGADFVDIKHCHGYLLHEFLGAHTRPGPYGGSFENRTRLLREIIQAIRARGTRIDLAVRLSAFDFVPFRPDPAKSRPGKPGPGLPEDYASCLPYRYGFGVNPERPVEADLSEPLEFLKLCYDLGIRLANLTAGSPYYNPHIQRPAAYPPGDGYQPAYDPLVDVVRQIQAVRWLRERLPSDLVLVGTGYTYLQDYMPHVAQAVVRAGWVDMVGVGRMVLSYDGFFGDILERGQLSDRSICRTFSDCTTAPRNGMVSGCYPLDAFYAGRPEASQLKAVKRAEPPAP